MKTKPIILLLASVGLFYAVISPQYQAVQGLREEAGELDRILENISDIDSVRNNLAAKYENIPEGEIDSLEKVLPDTPDLVGLALELDAIAGRNGATIQSIALNDSNEESIAAAAAAGEPYGSAPIEMSFVSDYESFRSILSEVEENLRITNIRSLSFVTADEEESGIFEYQISLDAYWLK